MILSTSQTKFSIQGPFHKQHFSMAQRTANAVASITFLSSVSLLLQHQQNVQQPSLLPVPPEVFASAIT